METHLQCKEILPEHFLANHNKTSPHLCILEAILLEFVNVTQRLRMCFNGDFSITHCNIALRKSPNHRTSGCSQQSHSGSGCDEAESCTPSHSSPHSLIAVNLMTMRRFLVFQHTSIHQFFGRVVLVPGSLNCAAMVPKTGILSSSFASQTVYDCDGIVCAHHAAHP
jgi:hypothetical protein